MTTATPTKKERRDQARQERVAREQAEAARTARRRRFTRLGAVLGAAVVVVAILVAVSSSGGGSTASTSSSASSSAPVAGAQASQSLLNGIPQKGLTLGNANAPVRVLEFADLQCPFCRDYTTGVMPGLVQKYVRTGKVRMEFHALAFIGPDSVRAARVAEAAGRQNKLWNVADLAYHNQGKENSGWATDAKLRSIAAAVPGLDVKPGLRRAQQRRRHGPAQGRERPRDPPRVNETPTFLVGRGSSLKPSTPPACPPRSRRPSGVMTDRLRTVAIAISVVGIAIAGYLTYVHYAGIPPCARSPTAARRSRRPSGPRWPASRSPCSASLGYVGILAALLIPGETPRPPPRAWRSSAPGSART